MMNERAELKKHSVKIQGHSTSFTLENAFYHHIIAIAQERNISIASLVADIDKNRNGASNLSSALRLYVLDDLQARSAAPIKNDQA